MVRAFLNSGIMDHGVVQSRDDGAPQGGPLSPLLANVMPRSQAQGGQEAAKYVQATHLRADRPFRRAQHAGSGATTSILSAGMERVLPTGSRPQEFDSNLMKLRAVQLKHWKRGTTMYRELLKLGAVPSVARQVAANSRRWWRNSAKLLNSVLTIAYFDQLGVPPVLTSTTRTARCGPACRVVRLGSGPFGLHPLCRSHHKKTPRKP